jgi:cysteine desulfurase / selenocysteine lyase
MGAVNVDWQKFRETMPVAQRWAYFDHAAVAPLSGPARDALSAWATQATEQGDAVWPLWDRRVEKNEYDVDRLLDALRPD